jgi:hypothetical protein
MTGDGNRPYRWRVRAPSYNNLQIIPAMLRGQMIADAPISVGSLDPCFSCTERMAVIDKDTGVGRIFTREEIMSGVRRLESSEIRSRETSDSDAEEVD